MTGAPLSKRSFLPVVDDATRVLILGSLPGDMSLARQQYYGKPQNQFWRLTGDAFGQDLVALTYPARLDALRECHIGLWDVFAAAHREGSLDSKIRDPVLNDLRGLAADLPQLRLIAFNGQTAARHGIPQANALEIPFLILPSSSPALTWSYDRKRAAWQALARESGASAHSQAPFTR